MSLLTKKIIAVLFSGMTMFGAISTTTALKITQDWDVTGFDKIHISVSVNAEEQENLEKLVTEVHNGVLEI